MRNKDLAEAKRAFVFHRVNGGAPIATAMAGHRWKPWLGAFERCEKQYIVCPSIQLPCTDLDSFAEKPVRFVKSDCRLIRAKHLKLYSLQALPECSIQGRLQQSLPDPLATEAGFDSHTEPADMRHPFKGRRSDVTPTDDCISHKRHQMDSLRGLHECDERCGCLL